MSEAKVGLFRLPYTVVDGEMYFADSDSARNCLVTLSLTDEDIWGEFQENGCSSLYLAVIGDQAASALKEFVRACLDCAVEKALEGK